MGFEFKSRGRRDGCLTGKTPEFVVVDHGGPFYKARKVVSTGYRCWYELVLGRVYESETVERRRVAAMVLARAKYKARTKFRS